MRKSVLAVMAAGSVFALTAAGAAGLSLTGSTTTWKAATSATQTVTVTACGAIAYTLNNTVGSSETIETVSLASSDPNCYNATVMVTIEDDSATGGASDTKYVAITLDGSGAGSGTLTDDTDGEIVTDGAASPYSVTGDFDVTLVATPA